MVRVMGGKKVKVTKTSIELPIDIYKKALLLIIKGDYISFKDVVLSALEMLFEEKYDHRTFEELENEYKEKLDELLSNIKIYDRVILKSL